MLIYGVMKPFEGKSIKTEVLSIVFLATFIITAALGGLSFYFSKNRLVTMLGESIKGVAATSSNFINIQDLLLILNNSKDISKRYRAVKDKGLAHILEKQSESEPLGEAGYADRAISLYIKYAQLLLNIKKMNNIDSPINVYVRDMHRLRLILTSDNAMLTGTSYTMRPEAEMALAASAPQATRIYKDRDGTWISAYAPILYQPLSKALAVIEINQKIDLYVQKLDQEVWIILLVCLVGFFSTALLSYQLVNRVARAVRKLDETAMELDMDNYDIRIDIKREDEIGHLARTFEKLRSSIREKIDELRLSLAREKKSHMESVLALTNIIELRDPAMRQHLYRVEKYALLIAKAMRLGREDIIKLRYSCYLHDIGKIGVESALLQKVKLSKEDFEEIKRHSEKGAKVIEGIQFLQEAKDVVLYHQERYDGKGYPKGLKGDEIPLLARVVAVADSFDAMTTDRPYKPKVSFQEAMRNIEEGSGTQFDPKVCEAFLKYRGKIEKIAKRHFTEDGSPI